MKREVHTVNISSASTTTNLFYLFFHGGKAALVPFLTLFFRLLGLSALEAGGIIAAKTLTGLIWAPIWSRCAATYNRHRLVMMFSIFMMMSTYLTFPALYTQLSKPEHCPMVGGNNSINLEHVPPVPVSDKHGNFGTTEKSPLTPAAPQFLSPSASQDTEMETPPTAESPTHSNDETASNDKDELLQETVEILEELGITDLKNISSLGLNISEEQLSQISALLKENEQNGRGSQEESSVDAPAPHQIVKRNWPALGDVKDQLKSIQSYLQNDKLLLFLVLLAITVGGEIFASPAEKVADDSWFDFLNRIDDLERYGQQRFWGSIAFVLIPIIVTIAIDNTPCFLPWSIHHSLLHFYVFAILMAAALITSCCYPVPPPASGKYSSKICKGIRIICGDGRGFLFSISLVLSGTVYAAYHNFLFWRIQDYGGKETTMGLCVSIGAFAEVPLLIFSGRLVKRLGNCWVVSLALFTLSLRTLCYAFITEPWAFLPVELTHGITHTSMWFAILSYDDFNVGAAIDRSLRSILSSFYFGFGFSVGSLVSGYIFDAYGSSVLFWSVSAVTGGWCVLFSIVQKCLPVKEKVRYIKLLRSDSDNSDEDNDDWLELALKDH